MARAGLSSWEADLRQGRSAEKAGRPQDAERSYRRALLANPASGALELDFSRFLEGRGRLRPAQEHLLRALRLGASSYEGLMALGRVRERLGRGGAAQRAFRGAALADPASPWPPNELARILIRSGRLTQARKTVEAAAARQPSGAAQAWPEVFSALLCARRYPAAFRLAEAMLRRSVTVANPNAFQWPWWQRVGPWDPAGLRGFCASELKRLRRAGGDKTSRAWYAYCRGSLLARIGTLREVMAEYRRIGPARSPREVYRHHPFVTYRLSRGDYGWVIGACRRLLRLLPEDWGLRCRLAEARLARGEAAGALREFERARRAADVLAKAEVMAWHGEALLWLGRYREALAKLDEAVASGALSWARGWRGAARLKLGDCRGALADLDSAIAADPRDIESRVWRGEAYRLMGRHAEAAAELTDCLRHGQANDWALCNRALARHALGDEAGLAVDFSAVSEDVTAFIRGRLGAPAGRALSPPRMRRILLAALERAKGLRRPEPYLRPIWMRPHEGVRHEGVRS
ncbi:MAG: tetratricopeptide repeat protein [Elusimicrobia bacterium]|nr:tetratricopeptide repeat protein [Elusimicrobiota bacterium]